MRIPICSWLIALLGSVRFRQGSRVLTASWSTSRCNGPSGVRFNSLSHIRENEDMNSDGKLAYAIAAILGGSAPSLAYGVPAALDGSDSIEEITVTAQRRSENIQDVPIAIQALTSETLAQLNVKTFDDLNRYLPNVSVKSNGPAQGAI